MNILKQLPPKAKKGEMVAMDTEFFGQSVKKLHRPHGVFACITVVLERDLDTAYIIQDWKELKALVRLVRDGMWAFHNAMYDVGWLSAEGITIAGKIIDTMIVATLLDENRFSYSLNALGFDYLQETKSEQGLRAAAKEFGVDPKGELYKLPAMYVGEYAEQDAALTLKLWQYFKIELIKQELTNIFDLESALCPHLINMTFEGVRFDVNRAQKTMADFKKKTTV